MQSHMVLRGLLAPSAVVSAAAPRSPLFGNVTRHAFFSNGGRGLLFGVLASGDLPHIVDYVLLFTFPSASSLSLGYVRGL
jgi:hypothetical protein